MMDNATLVVNTGCVHREPAGPSGSIGVTAEGMCLFGFRRCSGAHWPTQINCGEFPFVFHYSRFQSSWVQQSFIAVALQNWVWYSLTASVQCGLVKPETAWLNPSSFLYSSLSHCPRGVRLDHAITWSLHYITRVPENSPFPENILILKWTGTSPIKKGIPLISDI